MELKKVVAIEDRIREIRKAFPENQQNCKTILDFAVEEFHRTQDLRFLEHIVSSYERSLDILKQEKENKRRV